MVAVLGIAAFGAVHFRLRERGFDAEHSLGGIRRLFGRPPSQREDLGDVNDQVLPHLLHLRIVFLDVVIAVGQGQAALVHVGNHLIGMVKIGARVERK